MRCEGVRAALLTPPGRGALAVVALAGRKADAVVDSLFAARGGVAIAARPDGALAFGTWRPTGEEVIVVRHAGERLEIQCHGGIAAPAAVLASLEAAGARIVPWQEWLGDEGGDSCAAAALQHLPQAHGPKAARILARQAAGALDLEIGRVAGVMAGGDADAGTRAANRLRAAARVGLRLTCPWRIVLAGEVNAGKSSLMNALVGHGRSIVSPLEGTTRDIVTARTVLDGWEVEIVDVAGTRGDETAVSTIERAGIERALAERALADLVLRVIPADAAAGGGGPAAGHELLVLTKADLATEATLAAATATAAGAGAGAIVTSAVTGAGVDTLIAAIVERLVPEERLDPDLLAGAVPFTQRQLDAIETLVGPPRGGAGEQP